MKKRMFFYLIKQTGKRSLFACALFLLTFTISSVAQDSLGMSCISTLEYWQGADDIQMVGDIAYVMSGASGLHIMDLSDPANPVEIGRCTWYEFNSFTGGIHIVGSVAYVATGIGLFVYDIQNPAQPERIVHFGNVDWEMSDIFVHGDAGIAVSGEGYPGVLDLSDLQNIYQIGQFEPLGRPTDPIGMAGDYLCMNGAGLTIWDIDDPANPVRVAAIDTQSVFLYAEISGDFVYLSGNGVRIIDVSNPLTPVVVSSCDTGNTADVTVVNNHLVVSHYDHLKIWDVTIPESPVYVDSIAIALQQSPNRMTSSGNIVCVGSDEHRTSVAVLDFSEPAEPEVVSTFGREGLMRRVTVEGSTGYLSGSFSGGLCTFDYSNPSEIFELGSSQEFWPSTSYDAAVYDSYAYSAQSFNGGLVIYDVSNPAQPESLTCICWETGSDIFAIRTIRNDSLLYVSGDGIRTYSLQNPEELDSLSFVSGSLHHLSGDFLYGIDSRRFEIYSLNDPNHPQFVSDLELPFIWYVAITDIAIVGDYAYLAYNAGGVRIIDISDPEEPHEVSVFGGFTSVLDASGSTLITKEPDYIFLWDISDPINPTNIGFYETEERLRQILIIEPYLLTLAYSQLRVYEVDVFTNADNAPESIPQAVELYPCYPNPFNPSTTISFSLPQSTQVRLNVYDVTGRQITSILDERVKVG